MSSVHLYPTIDVELPTRIRCSSQLWMNSSALPSSIVLRQLASVLSSSSGFKSAHELIEGKEIMSPERSFFCVLEDALVNILWHAIGGHGSDYHDN